MSSDVIVVIPGILGSQLFRGGAQIWGLPGGIIRNLAHPGLTLALEGDGYDVDPSMRAEGLVRTPVHFPDLAKVDGLRQLIDLLCKKAPPRDVLVFAYDWRLSNRVNGRLLAERVQAWRRRSGDRHARLTLVCHSMGGLVARVFLDLEGGAEQCRRLVTLGTPYFGSVKALGCLVNGVCPWSGWIGAGLTKLARTWPSVYELLPSYPAIVDPSGTLTLLVDTDMPGLDSQRFHTARAFHDQLRGPVKARQFPPYEVTAVIGHLQPTFQFAQPTSGGVRLLTQYEGVDLRGDGTVPRQGACPPDWDNDGRGTFLGQTHLGLPSSRRVLHHLHGVLTAMPRPPMAVEFELSIDVPELVLEDQPFQIAAQATNPRLALAATITPAEGGAWIRRVLQPRDNRHVATFQGLPPGTYQATISPAARTVKGVEPSPTPSPSGQPRPRPERRAAG